nr:TonB-dependent receptor [Arcobacter vandammei]
MGGVINIITKKDHVKPFYGEIDVQAGVSNAKHGGDEQKYSLNVGGNISDKLSINVSADNQHRDATGGKGINAFEVPLDKATYIEGIENTNGSVKLRYNIDDTQYISGTYAKGQEKRKDYEKSQFTRTDLYKLDREMYNLSYEKNYEHLTLNLDYELAKTDIQTNMCLYPFGALTPYQVAQQVNPNGNAFQWNMAAMAMPKDCLPYFSNLADYKSKIKNEIVKAEVKTDILKYNYIVLGATTNKESFEKYDYKKSLTTDDYDRRANSYYIQDEIELKDFIFTLGGVLDDNEKYGTKWSSNVGVVYKIDDKQRLKLSYGEGFKAPDVRKSTSSYISSQGTDTYGNDNLQPETSKTYELAYEFYGEDTTFKTAVFRNEIDDMIANIKHPTINRAYQYQNIDEAIIKGFEIEGSYDFTENHSLNANYTYLKTEDKTTNKEITFRPKNTFNAGLSSRFAYDISSYLSASYVGKQYTDTTNDEQIKGYTLVNAQISKKLTKDLTARVGVDNIFDKKLDDNGEFHLKRRFVYAGLNYKF